MVFSYVLQVFLYNIIIVLQLYKMGPPSEESSVLEMHCFVTMKIEKKLLPEALVSGSRKGKIRHLNRKNGSMSSNSDGADGSCFAESPEFTEENSSYHNDAYVCVTPPMARRRQHAVTSESESKSRSGHLHSKCSNSTSTGTEEERAVPEFWTWSVGGTSSAHTLKLNSNSRLNLDFSLKENKLLEKREPLMFIITNQLQVKR